MKFLQDLVELNAAVLAEAVSSLEDRLAPGQGGAYCDELEIPHVGLADGYAARVATIRALVTAGDHEVTSAAARELVDDLPDYLVALGGDNLSQREDELRKRLMTPPVLLALRERSPFWYYVVLISLFADESISQWYPQGSGPERMVGLLKDIGPMFSTGTTADSGWPYWTTYAISVGALLTSIVADGKLGAHNHFDVAIGWSPGETPDNAKAEELAAHGATMWWERRRLTYAPVHYEGTLDDVPAGDNGALVAITLVPVVDGPTQTTGIWTQLRVETEGPSADSYVLPVSDDWELALGLGLSGALLLGRNFTGAAGADLSLELRRTATEEWLSLGKPGLGASLRSIRYIARAEAGLDGGDAFDLLLKAKIDGLRLDLSTIIGDGFLAKMMPEGLSAGFDVGLGWSLQRGFHVDGGPGRSSSLPTQSRSKTAKGFALDVSRTLFDVGARKAESGGYQVFAKVSPSVRCDFGGVVTLGVEGLGAELVAGAAEGGAGELGPLDLDLKLTPPTGIAVTIDAGSVKGGGFLAKGDDRWSGALELEFASWSLAGVGLVQGDSVLAVAWAQGLGGAPGWSLEGLGALVGLDRRADRDALFEGLQSGALGSVLFPENPAENAAEIISALGRFFPRAEESFVFGAMARAVFGGADVRLVTADIGLVLSIVRARLDSLYILGRAEIRVPVVPTSLFRVNVDLLGAVDLSSGAVELRLMLRDSRLGGAELTGDGLFRRAPGEGFIASLGGFHPRYRYQSGLAPMRRLAVSLVDSDKLKLGLQAYIALTSSSFQLGAKASLWATAAGFTLEGQLGFDLLIEFDLGFVLDLVAQVVLKRGARQLAAVGLEGTLSGSSTWRIKGKARLELLFLSVTVPFSHTTSGSSADAGWLPPDLRSIAAAALAEPENWSTEDRGGGVVFTQRPRSGVWIPSQGSIKVSQRALPLHQSIDRYGPARLQSPAKIEIDAVTVDDDAVGFAVVQDDFAPGLYFVMADDEALSAPAFEPMDSGLDVELAGVAIGEAVGAVADYEELILDRDGGELALSALADGDSDIGRWTITDDGDHGGASAWALVDGHMRQTSNIYSLPTTREGIDKRGTFALCGEPEWIDLSLRATILSDDDDAVGLMFRVVDDDNYYRFSVDAQRAYRRLVKRVDGEFTLLWESADGYPVGEAFDLRISARGADLRVWLDDEELLSIRDTSHARGRVGLYTWGNAPARFSDLVVRTRGEPARQGAGASSDALSRAALPLSRSGEAGFYRPSVAPVLVQPERYALLEVAENEAPSTFATFSAAREARISQAIPTSAGTGRGAPARLQVALLHEVNKS